MDHEPLKFISLFSGGGLADVGAKAAGFELVAANEYDPQIADVYRRNHGDHIRVADILDENPNHYPDCDLLHASPVCKNASIANPYSDETELDIATGEKTALFVRSKKPRFFTLENVSGYRKFKAFKKIIQALDEGNYFYHIAILNSANFGVPQTRRRLIVRAVKNGFVPALPKPVRWVGWYEAVEDLIHTFPESRFAPWQLARLPEQIDTFLMAGSGNTNFNDAEPGNGVRYASDPAHTISSFNGGRFPRAFIVGQQKFNDQLDIAIGNMPAHTVTASSNQKHLRAFIVSGGQAQNYQRRVDDGSTTKATIRMQNEPVFTITAQMPRTPARAWLQDGKVVRITARGLARFQSLHDGYELPENENLACKIIGNGLPPLMYQIIAQQFYGYGNW